MAFLAPKLPHEGQRRIPSHQHSHAPPAAATSTAAAASCSHGHGEHGHSHDAPDAKLQQAKSAIFANGSLTSASVGGRPYSSLSPALATTESVREAPGGMRVASSSTATGSWRVKEEAWPFYDLTPHVHYTVTGKLTAVGKPEVEYDAGGPLVAALHCLEHEAALNIVTGAEDKGTLTARDSYGATPLHWAVWMGFSDVVDNLLQRCPELAASRTFSGQTPIMWLALQREHAVHLPLARKLRAVHAEASLDRDEDDITLLMLAAQSANRALALFAVMTGVDVDAKDRNGTSALHWAAFAGSTDLVRFLVASGANTGAQDNEGAVALHRAVQANHAGLVGVMIDHPMYRMGMQFYARDKQNRTPLKLARDLNHGACVAEILAIQRQGVEDLAQRKPYVFPGVYLGLVLLCMLLYWFYLLPATWESMRGLNQFSLMLLATWLGHWLYMSRIPAMIADTPANRATLERAIVHGEGNSSLNIADVCFTCRIQRPLRSKHDSVSNHCHYRFDHYCGWLARVIDEGTHRNFVVHLTMEFLGHVLFLVFCIATYYLDPTLVSSPWSATHLILALAANLFGLLFSTSLGLQHWKFVLRELTTNETFNWKKYDYLLQTLPSGDVVFHNPFDHGPVRNFMRFWVRSRAGPRRYTPAGGAFDSAA